tara:strand:+ start:2986 stop:3237 length:252 start_codon:yes stop_codon:yes gene_type:complete
MYLNTEKILLKNDYKGFHYLDATIYIHNIDQISIVKQVNEYNQNTWHTSFPLKTSRFNYTCGFKTEQAANKYLQEIITNYFKL